MEKISLREARIGMVLAEPVMSKDGQSLLLKTGQVLNPTVLLKLREWEVSTISVADIYSLQINPIDQMHLVLKASYDVAISKYASTQAVGNKRNDIPKIVKKMLAIIDYICKNEVLLDYCLQMKMIKEKDLYLKAVETSVFSGLLAGVKGCSNHELLDIMIGGLLHDSGCLEMPFLIGRSPVTKQEELLWKEHPTYGYYFAIQNNLSREVAAIIQCHEEKYDGSGYPKQLKGEDIPLGARIVSLCANITENIIYNNMKPHEALEVIYSTGGIYFDSILVKLFTESIALYPMGALVRLSTGEVGIIINIRKNHGPRPIVNVHYNSFGKPLSKPKVVDLGIERTVFIDEILG